MRSIALGMVLLGACTGTLEQDSEPADATAWMKGLERTLDSTRGAQWTVKLEVRRAIDELFPRGVSVFQFDLAGPHRLHWVQESGAGRVEAWYRGFVLYTRHFTRPDKLFKENRGEREGECMARTFAAGGFVGWNLIHRIMMGRVEAKDPHVVGEEIVDGRPAIVIDYTLKLGSACGSSRDYPGVRVWIDRERKVPIQRHHRLLLNVGGTGVPFEAIETYYDWRFDEPIPEAIFEGNGVGPRDPISDLPSDPEAFERVQTEKALGVSLRTFPQPQGPAGFDDRRTDASTLRFQVAPRAPLSHTTGRSLVTSVGPDGTVYEGIVSDDSPNHISRGHAFLSERTNRRHLYGGGVYYPQDVWIGVREEAGTIRPLLFFRDVGSHNKSPHHFAVDASGLCHLAVADVDVGQENRFRLYLAVGDPRTGRWKEAWLVDHTSTFTSSAQPWVFAAASRVQVLWLRDHGKKDKESGLFHVEWAPEGPGRKTRIVAGAVREADATIEAESGRLMVAWTTDEGLFIASRKVGATWTRPARLEEAGRDTRAVFIRAGSPGVSQITVFQQATSRGWEVRMRE